MATQLETFLQEINDAFSRGDIGFFAENSTDDVRWEMVGDTFTEGKRALIESMQGLEDSAPPDITVENVITHGHRAAVLGTMKGRRSGRDEKLRLLRCLHHERLQRPEDSRG